MQQGMRRRALAAAFPHTVPILAGFLFLGGEAQSVLPARMCRSPFRFLYNVVYW